MDGRQLPGLIGEALEEPSRRPERNVGSIVADTQKERLVAGWLELLNRPGCDRKAFG
jgi:hypothetical protein